MYYALKFIEKFTALSKIDICIYACPGFIEEEQDNRLAKYPLWCAYYGVDRPGFTKVWGSSYAGHQYTEKGSIDGVNGNVDMNNFNEGILTGSKMVQAAAVDTNNIYIPLQEELNRQGFKDKNGNALTVDGVPGELTLSACPVIKLGARGNITRWLQEELNIDADGDFGDMAEEAVKTFQRTRGLFVDGVVRKETWRALLNI